MDNLIPDALQIRGLIKLRFDNIKQLNIGLHIPGVS